MFLLYTHIKTHTMTFCNCYWCLGTQLLYIEHTVFILYMNILFLYLLSTHSKFPVQNFHPFFSRGYLWSVSSTQWFVRTFERSKLLNFCHMYCNLFLVQFPVCFCFIHFFFAENLKACGVTYSYFLFCGFFLSFYVFPMPRLNKY